MTIDECMSYIHKTVWLGSKPGLSRTRELLGKIGNPQRSLKFIHVVGTNGKGSMCAMLSLALKNSGYRVGTFVSPYIVAFNERIQINGEPIPDEALCKTVERIKPHADSMVTDPPTEFELITAVGFEYFKDMGCDIVVLEAGMGGALDSTNVIDTPVASVFAAIGLDHMEQLGNSIEEIAHTKAGILKRGTVAVFNGEETPALPVLEKECKALDIPFTVPDKTCLNVTKSDIFGSIFDYKDYTNIKLALAGIHQVYNAITVIETIRSLNGRGFNIPKEAVYNALENVRWPARFEIISKVPLVIFDGAHNINGVTKLAENVENYFMPQKPVMLMGVMADKEYGTMLDLLMPLCKRLYAVKPNNPRALSAETLAAEAEKRGVPATAITLTPEDIQGVVSSIAEDEVLLIMGSLYMYGDIMGCMDFKAVQD